MVRSLFVVVVSVVLLAGLFLTLHPDGRAGGPRERTFGVSVEEGEMRPRGIPVDEGDRVTLRVEADEPLEVHLHGYDVVREVGPEGEARISFEATLTGRFGIEDHRSGEELGALRVRPR